MVSTISTNLLSQAGTFTTAAQYKRCARHLQEHNNKVGELLQAPKQKPADELAEGYFNALEDFEARGKSAELADIVDLFCIPSNAELLERLIVQVSPEDEAGKELSSVTRALLQFHKPKHNSNQITERKDLEVYISILEKLLHLKEHGIGSGLITVLSYGIKNKEIREIIAEAKNNLSLGKSIEDVNDFIKFSLTSKETQVFASIVAEQFGDKTFHLKSRIAELIEPKKSHTDTEALEFVDNICTLKKTRYSDGSEINGVDRLLNKVLNNTEDHINGFYREAEAAVTLLTAGKKVTYLSLNFEVGQNGKPKKDGHDRIIQLIDSFGKQREIDIVMEDNGKTYHLEVKSTPSVLYEKNFQQGTTNKPYACPQAVVLSEIAKRYGAIAGAYLSKIENGPQRNKVIDVRQMVYDKTGNDMRVFVGGFDSSDGYPIRTSI